MHHYTRKCTIKSLPHTFSYILGLGKRWGPAIINSREEFDFIFSRQLQVQYEKRQVIGVGGSSNNPNATSYSDYLPDKTGKYKYWQVCFNLVSCHEGTKGSQTVWAIWRK